jgi:hypothetical protein
VLEDEEGDNHVTIPNQIEDDLVSVDHIFFFTLTYLTLTLGMVLYWSDKKTKKQII